MSKKLNIKLKIFFIFNICLGCSNTNKRFLNKGNSESIIKEKDKYNQQMTEAAREGDICMVKKMLKKGANDFNTAMLYASKSGSLEVVQLMLDKAFNHNEANAKAAFYGYKEIVELFIDKGVSNYDWVMKSAAEGGHIEIIKMMLDRGANINNIVLLKALKAGHINIVEFLIDRGADLELNFLMFETAKYGHIEMVQMLMDRGADNHRDVMFEAAKNGQIEIVSLMLESLLKNDCRKEIQHGLMLKNNNIHSILHQIVLFTYREKIEKENLLENNLIFGAARRGHVQIIELILEKAASTHNWALAEASKEGIIFPLSTLLEELANKYDQIMNRALSIKNSIIQKMVLSIYWEKVDEKNMLQDIKKNFVKINKNIHYPVSNYNFEKAFLLSSIQHSKNIYKKHLYNLPNEMVAKIFSYLDIRCKLELIFLYSNRDFTKEEIQMIEIKEWNEYTPINVMDKNGLTMLHKLCYYGHKNKVNFLLEKGALRNIEDRSGKRPLWYAKEGATKGEYVESEAFVQWSSQLILDGLK